MNECMDIGHYTTIHTYIHTYIALLLPSILMFFVAIMDSHQNPGSSALLDNSSTYIYAYIAAL